jgi:hypothetical protein
MPVFIVLAALEALAGILVLAGAPTITQEIAGIICLTSGILTGAVSVGFHRLINAVEAPRPNSVNLEMEHLLRQQESRDANR